MLCNLQLQTAKKWNSRFSANGKSLLRKKRKKKHRKGFLDDQNRLIRYSGSHSPILVDNYLKESFKQLFKINFFKIMTLVFNLNFF